MLKLGNSGFRFYPKRLHKTQDATSLMDIPTGIEEELVECGKAVFIDEESEIARYQQHLQKKYPFIETYVGSNSVMGEWKGLKFNGPKNSRVLRTFKSLLESGIYSYYTKNYIRKETAPDNRRISKEIKKEMFKSWKYWEPVKALDMKSSANTLFIVWISGLGLGGWLWAGENLKAKHRREAVRNWVKLRKARVRKKMSHRAQVPSSQLINYICVNTNWLKIRNKE